LPLKNKYYLYLIGALLTPPNVNNNVNTNNINTSSNRTVTRRTKSTAAKPGNSVFYRGKFKEEQSVITAKVKDANGNLKAKKVVKIKDLEYGRSLVVDQNGKEWVMAHDGVILKASYAAQPPKAKAKAKTVPYKQGINTANLLVREFNSAQKAFNAQMEKDGWAADLADGISRAWTWATKSKNSANYVREDLKIQKKNVQDLQRAARQGEQQFKIKFKEIYGVNYNQKAIDAYIENPTEENYKKAFGSKVKNIKTRVKKYNKSQDTGAIAVKTTAKVGTGIAIGMATGGTGLVALGGAAIGTTVTSIAIEETDHLKVTQALTQGKFEFREGTSHTQILKDSAWDGVSVLAGGAVGKVTGTMIKGTSKLASAGRGAINTAGDVAVGAAQEYAETGKVSTTGVLTNTVMSGTGSVIIGGALKHISKGHSPTSSTANNSQTSTHSNVIMDDNGIILAGGDPTSSSEKGFFSRLRNAFSSETPIEKQLRETNSAKTQRAMDNGLNEAIAQGKVRPDILENINRKGSKVSISDSTTGYAISDRLVDALERQNKGNTFVTRLAGNINPENISKYIKNGDVASINGKLYINNNGKSVPINLSQEKFDKLFDPMKLATMSQDGGTHVCVATSQINSMLETPQGRTQLFTMLEETSDGIVVNLANGKKPVFFPGGKPVKMPGRFLTGAPDGIQMIEQAFMANNIKKASTAQITDISTLSAENLGQQSTDIMNRRSTGDAARDIGGTREITFSTKKTVQGQHVFKDNAREDLEKILNDFVPGQDVMVCHWSGHAKSVVNYDPATQIVTYRDPMSSGVDTQCTLTQFLNKGSHDYGLNISLQKGSTAGAGTPTAQSLPKGYTDAGTMKSGDIDYQIVENKYGVKYVYSDGELTRLNEFSGATQIRPPAAKQTAPIQSQPESQPVHQPASHIDQQTRQPAANSEPTLPPSDFVSKTTELSAKPYVVAHTADGNPIGASITNSNVIIIKDGKRTAVKIPEHGTEIPVHETSTDTYLIIKNDNGKISITTSETETLPQTRVTTGNETATLSNNRAASRPAATRTSRPALEIPQGAKLIDTVTIMGKQCRRIQMPNGEYLTEFGGKWKKL